MKNVQIIDGAENCTYSIYQLSDEEFSLVFPGEGQNVEFIEDVIARLGDAATGQILKPAWTRPVRKELVQGIHGTLFYQLAFKKLFYPTKREDEMVTGFEQNS